MTLHKTVNLDKTEGFESNNVRNKKTRKTISNNGQ